MPAIKWNADLYENKHSFVAQYGEDVVGLLQPKAGERILDLGCGTGTLTNEIAEMDAEVIGIDASPDMIEKAKAAYPALDFVIADASNFSFDNKFDAIFSNATLHWITKYDEVINCMYKNLKLGGRLVLEMGGKGNIKSIADAVKKSMKATGLGDKISTDFWYFPSLSEYTTLLEKQGFRVEIAHHFERPTKLSGLDGMKNWIEMFGSFFFSNISAIQAEEVINKAVEQLIATNFINNIWYADYWRLRIKAIKA
ncbi:class I SAM-dependent methyltransferase [Arachidicoccus soli]|uniref:Class I SAM-dependent methyltransferase n=1 Tax=Arachidicoccus soli TaxID=2341117 RepID=A0A386HM51_9BACT|nr:class I SAM-dependent methyltransferase [Arachidicoccus soli]AYD46855.1 class I SAM-dependent methyltransferase [Arachidicoccus soli]